MPTAHMVADDVSDPFTEQVVAFLDGLFLS
jgi:hypothetical protein